MKGQKEENDFQAALAASEGEGMIYPAKGYYCRAHIKEAIKNYKRHTTYEQYRKIDVLAREYGLVHCDIRRDADPEIHILRHPVTNQIVSRGIKKRTMTGEPIHALPHIQQRYDNARFGTLPEEEKQERAQAFIELYAEYGVGWPAANAVGVSYLDLIEYINQDAVLLTRLKLARISVKQLLEDVGRFKALQGDSSMLKFFIERENPNVGRGDSGGDQAISEALKHIREAREDAKIIEVVAHPVREGPRDSADTE